MDFIWNVLPLSNWIISLVLILAVYAFLLVINIKVISRKFGYGILICSFVLAILTFFLNLMYAFILAVGATVCFVVVQLFANLGDLRKFIANPFKISKSKNSKVAVEKIYNREKLYHTIEAAVLALSTKRVGAIMTFEKSTSLDDFLKNGIIIKAPVTRELLETIFYPGTRLHDGAVIIKDNIILAASVFYTPTTKPFAGKYGSRHRAALGISEVSDAITVVVSEETGRISFAVNGSLESVTPENFYRVFENYMGGSKED